ncbi:glycoside hydrolase superfamily [Aspergillus granulosus]|uniref:beta-glucosidase n=1 Tax=Aspergillus granulosus TaxID=176169 RepID=A0ABR4HXS5_9EURO
MYFCCLLRVIREIPASTIPDISHSLHPSASEGDLAVETGHVLATEAKANGAHVVLSPTINIQRGPLGGRGFESFFEDPVLSGIPAGSYCRGLKERNISATLKHCICNDQEHERLAVSSIVTDRALREIYLLPFQIAIALGSPDTIMTSYNKVNGVHAAENQTLLQDILRREWGWDGLVVSDWFGTYSTSEARGAALTHAPAANKISRAALDSRVRAVLKLRAPETQLDRPEDRALLRKVPSESIVLLKNEDKTLPFSKNITIAVIGPNTNIHGIYAHQVLPLLGWHLVTEDVRAGFTLSIFNDPATTPLATRTPLEQRHETDSMLIFMDYKYPELQATWYADAEGYFTSSESGIYDFGLTIHGTGRMFVDGGLLINNADADVQTPGTSFFGSGTVEETASLALEAGRRYKVHVQWGCGKTATFRVDGVVDFGHGGFRFGARKRLEPRDGIEEAVKVASDVDQWEAEGEDLAHMGLPPHTDELISRVLDANPMPWVHKAKAILHAWYGGNETGNAIADVVFGDVNPSAKLLLTFPRRLRDNPTIFNYRSEGGQVLYGEDVYVGYRYYDGLDLEPLFPFGYGLSYTTFELSDLELVTHAGEESKDILRIKCRLRNTGSRSGAEVVQVYVSPVSPPTKRPVKELKEFRKCFLEACSEQTVTLELDLVRVTSFWDEKSGRWCSHAGKYEIMVGMSSHGNI